MRWRQTLICHGRLFTLEIDCDIAYYANPTEVSELGVGVGSVADPDHAEALLDAIQAVIPGGQTPTLPALQGALEYAKRVYSSNRPVAVVLITDGLPTQCQDLLSFPQILGVAEEAYWTEPSVRTHAIAVGPGLEM